MIVDSNVIVNHPIYPEESALESIINILDEDRVDKAGISTLKPMADYQYKDGNSFIGEVVKKYPKRFFGLAVINPFDLDETDRSIKDLGMKGVKLYPNYQWFYLDDALKVGERASKMRVPINVNVDPPRPSCFAQCGELAMRFPETEIIMGTIWSVHLWPEALVLAKKFKNLYLEIGPVASVFLKQAVKKLGAHRVVLGSGAPVMRPRAVIDHVNMLDITREEKDLVLGGNAESIFKL